MTTETSYANISTDDCTRIELSCTGSLQEAERVARLKASEAGYVEIFDTASQRVIRRWKHGKEETE